MPCSAPVRLPVGKPINNVDKSTKSTDEPSLLAVYTKKAMIKIGLRPYCSDSGPQRIGPTQYPATNKDIVKVPTSPEKPNWCLSCGTIPEGAELANVLWHIVMSKKNASL